MLRTTFLILASLAAPQAYGQKHELTVLAGATTAAAEVGIASAASVSGGSSAAVQVNFATELHDGGSWRLKLELPAARVAKASVDIGENHVGAGASKFFFTPGLRFELPTNSRLTPYASGGFGFGWFDDVSVRIGPDTRVRAGSGIKPAASFGGGLHLKFTERFGMRAEARDYVPVSGGVSGFHHFTITAGFSFRF